MMTKAQDLKAGMKFDNFGDVMEIVSVRAVDGGVIVQWSGFYGNEFVESGWGIELRRA